MRDPEDDRIALRKLARATAKEERLLYRDILKLLAFKELNKGWNEDATSLMRALQYEMELHDHAELRQATRNILAILEAPEGANLDASVDDDE